MTGTHRFPYEWTLKDAVFTKDKGKVFSCFACGGGSTMGYKLAGFDVIGCNEIDPKMAECYKANHNPKYCFVEPIQTFKDRDDLPEELYHLDILDGSPPCSSFSMIGNRAEDWGKDKKFREGQAEQVLDTLFFDFIDLAKRLQPKAVVAENVKGLLLGDAQRYVDKILTAFNDAGYFVDFTLLDAGDMGVPQRRERVIFYAVRKDIYSGTFTDLFSTRPSLGLEFGMGPVPFRDIEDHAGPPLFDHPAPSCREGWELCSVGEKLYQDKKFDSYKIDPDKILNTITASCSKGRSGPLHYEEFRMLTRLEVFRAGSFPTDYKCGDPYYMVGMSVPPVMMARIATRIHEQWLTQQEATT